MPEPVPLARVRELLTEEAAHRTLPREASLAHQHAEQFARLSNEQTTKLIEELRTLPYVDTAIAVKVADTMPQYPEEIRLVFSKERVPLDEEQVAKLLEIVAHYR